MQFGWIGEEAFDLWARFHRHAREGRPCRPGGLLCLVALSILPCRVTAQNCRSSIVDFRSEIGFTIVDRQASIQNPGPSGQTNLSPERPLLLLVPPHSSSTPAARRDDPEGVLVETLREALRASQQFEILLYSPTQPLIKRALLEHAISAADLMEPLQSEPLQRLARVIGARYVLTVRPSLTKEGMKTDVQLQEATGPQTWRTPLIDSITAEAMAGKKRLSVKDMVAITVDDITARMGVPSHLAAGLRRNIHVVRGEGEKGKAEKHTPEPKTPAAPPDAEKSLAGSAAPKPAHTSTTSKKKIARTEKEKPASPPRPQTQAAVPPKVGPQTVPSHRSEVFTTDASPGSPIEPTPDVTAPAVGAAREDYEAEAARYRQTGDLANAIVALRHAINDRPRDLSLRRQLIQAYLDRQMPDAALSEAARAQALAPHDGALCVLYGNALLAKGDVAGATKAFQEAVSIDPGDITAEVALGDAQLADSQFDAAIQAYEAAAKTDPKSPLPHRRLARALATRAAADPAQYAASLAQVQQARTLIPATDVDTYQQDYVILMRLMDSRLRDLLEEMQTTYRDASSGGNRSPNALIRSAADVKTRAEAAADYLDKLPPAAGLEAAHAHYQQGAALLLQAVDLLRDYLNKPDTGTGQQLQGAQVDALRELDTGSKRLEAGRAAPQPPPDSDTSGTDNPTNTSG
ncbi:MAG TPA: tetratricopeptide repeat protein [Chthonomonadaceae bacterium]|nr:tetratricopeptide repeat protein [Chthonomonadaceae bacterium]